MRDFGVPCRMSDGEEVVAAVVAVDAGTAVRIVRGSLGPEHAVRDSTGRQIPGFAVEVVGPAEPLDGSEAP